MCCVRMSYILAVACLSLISAAGAVRGEDRVAWLTDLDLGKMTCGWGAAVKDRSCTTQELSIAGHKFARGVGAHAESVLWVSLDGQAREFTAEVGVDDDNQKGHSGTLEFAVLGDGRELWKSGILKSGDAARHVQVPLAGVRSLLLLATDGGDGISFDHADWAEAKIAYGGAAPQAVDMPAEEATILTPAAPREPRINGPRV